MESSKVFGDEEECNSSESGWTMYICSPTHSDDDDGEIDDGGGDEHEDESDDSMASDASSGPSPLEHSWGYGKIDDAIYDDDKQLQVLDDNGGKQFTNKNAGGKQFTNKKAKYQDQKEDHSVFAAKQAKVSVQSNGKVKKNGWFGKTK